MPAERTHSETAEGPEHRPDLLSGLREIDARVEELANLQDTVTVHLSGGSGTGKSLASERLQDRFGNDLLVVPMDNYYIGRRQMEKVLDSKDWANYDHPDAFDRTLLHNHIAQLRQGKPLDMPVYDFVEAERSGTVPIEPAKIILVEGLYALHDDLADQADFGVFFQTSSHGKLLRRLMRDPKRTGQKLNDIIGQIADTVEPMYQEHVAATSRHADLIVENEYDAQVEAARIPTKECHLKFKHQVSDHDILATGAALLGNTLQRDVFFVPERQDIRAAQEILRVRQEMNHRLTFTYKGPELGGGETKVRPSLTVPITPALQEKLNVIYRRTDHVVMKERALFIREGVIFSRDHVHRVTKGKAKPVGAFLEVRSAGDGTDAEAIERWRQALKVPNVEPIRRSYYEL